MSRDSSEIAQSNIHIEYTDVETDTCKVIWPLVHQPFHVQDQDQAQVSKKNNFRTISNYLVQY